MSTNSTVTFVTTDAVDTSLSAIRSLVDTAKSERSVHLHVLCSKETAVQAMAYIAKDRSVDHLRVEVVPFNSLPETMRLGGVG